MSRSQQMYLKDFEWYRVMGFCEFNGALHYCKLFKKCVTEKWFQVYSDLIYKYQNETVYEEFGETLFTH